jgi:hypothetical protein
LIASYFSAKTAALIWARLKSHSPLWRIGQSDLRRRSCAPGSGTKALHP